LPLCIILVTLTFYHLANKKICSPLLQRGAPPEAVRGYQTNPLDFNMIGFYNFMSFGRELKKSEEPLTASGGAPLCNKGEHIFLFAK